MLCSEEIEEKDQKEIKKLYFSSLKPLEDTLPLSPLKYRNLDE